VNAFPATDDVPVTAHGYEQLCSELELLRTVRRHELAESLRELRDNADADNPALFDLMEELTQLEAHITHLEEKIATARIVTPATNGSAGIGSSVQVRHADGGEVAEYVLVGPIESDVGNGRVSVAAPVGRALMGTRRGDVVAAQTPRGTTRLEVLAVRAAS
jgi:transcription elongation factor GreA